MKRAALFLLLVTILSLAWCATRPTTVSIINRSGRHLDSVVLHVQNIRKAVYGIPAGASYTWYVPVRALQYNGHDVTVRAAAYPRQDSVRYGYWYDDLPFASVPRNTVVTLHDDGRLTVLDADLE